MEVVTGTSHRVFPIDDPSRVGEARRFAASLAQTAGWGAEDSGRLALVVTEMGTNLVKHARGGSLFIADRGTSRGDIETLSVDSGPGIHDLAQCMTDGFSTGGSPGTGLGAIRRVADDFDAYSAVPAGTIAVARVRPHQRAAAEPATGYRMGSLAVPMRHETANGDSWAVATDGTRGAAMVADGLGHGPSAAEASLAAVAVFARMPLADLAAILEASHAALKSTRGAAVSLAGFDAEGSSVRSVGAGNVTVRIVSAASDRTVLSQHGTVGLQMRKPVVTTTDWPPHALIVLHTDGILARWKADAVVPLLGRDPSLVAGLIMRDYCRHTDDATVVVIRRKG